MNSPILNSLRLDPFYIFVLIFLIQVMIIVLLVNVNMKYNRLKKSYMIFMKGKDGENLEKSFIDKFNDVDSILNIVKKNRQDIKVLNRKLDMNFQKVGIVRYDAFHEMGGNLSFVLTMLDGNNSGWILNAMHSREGCYTYIKEIVNGESYIELSEEEAESLDKAIYKEGFALDVEDMR